MRYGPFGPFSIAFVIVALAFPFLTEAAGSSYLVPSASRMLIFALAAVSLDLLVGYAGLVSLGHAAYLGIGAYVVAILSFHAADGSTVFGFDGTTQALISIPLAVIVSALVAFGLGLLCLRTRGIYFIMITLAFAQMIFFAMVSLERYGGDDGLFMSAGANQLGSLDLSNEWVFFYVCLATLIGFIALSHYLVNSRFGRTVNAARQNEARMITLGANVDRHRLAMFVIAGAGAGLAGALLANQASFVSPDLLAWTRSGELLFMVILGGTMSLFGPVIGAIFFLLLEEYLPVIFDMMGSDLLKEHWRIVFGPMLIVIVLLNRRGLYGLLTRQKG